MPGSEAKVVEAGWVRLLKTRVLVVAASENFYFRKGDLLLLQQDQAERLGVATSDSVRRTFSPSSYVEAKRFFRPPEAKTLLEQIRVREAEAKEVFKKEVERYGLEMHLSAVEVIPSGRIIFYFTAPGRVDFRALVRSLAGLLKTRVELRQIGVRDETRCMGGIGPCGLELCCSTFLREFTSVSIRMAKCQGCALNPQKVSGLCGRLMCCLAYEHDLYLEILREFPKVGSIVMTPKGEGKVRENMAMKRTVLVALAPSVVEEFPLEEVKVISDEEEPQGGEEEGQEEEEMEFDGGYEEGGAEEADPNV